MFNQQGNDLTLRSGVNLFYIVVNAYAMCFLPFSRHTFGSEAFAWSGPAALVLMIVYGGFANCDLMVPYMGIWLVLIVFHRIRTAWLLRRGWSIHTRYQGTPWLGFMVPFVRKTETAKFWETSSCLVIGPYLCYVNESLGQFILFGYFGLLAKWAIDNHIEIKRIQRMRDAEIEMRDMVDRMRQRDF